MLTFFEYLGKGLGWASVFFALCFYLCLFEKTGRRQKILTEPECVESLLSCLETITLLVTLMYAFLVYTVDQSLILEVYAGFSEYIHQMVSVWSAMVLFFVVLAAVGKSNLDKGDKADELIKKSERRTVIQALSYWIMVWVI